MPRREVRDARYAGTVSLGPGPRSGSAVARTDNDGVMAIRVLLADDHPVVRYGLTAMLDAVEDIDVVASVPDGPSALREAQLCTPDVAILDIRMPGVDGVEATRRLRATVPKTAVLLLTMYDDDATVFTAMQAGARGYLLKGVSQDEITTAIRAVAAGQVIFGAGMATRIMTYFSQAPASTSSAFPQLTERELEILELLASGCGTVEISARTHLAQKTVSNQLTGIFAKLQVANRTEAVIRARDAGLGTLREA
jgi:DNA-binding NarL/FixJ family response regulator